VKKLAFVVAAACLFALGPVADRFGPVGSSIALVWLGILVAVTASGSAQALAVAAGALGAFGSGVLGSVSPAAAGAVMIAAAFAERTTRVRSKTARALHVLVALVGGALAGSLSSAFTAASIPVFAVAVVVASVLAALPLLVEADDPVAHALEQAALDVSEPARASLREGAELRRHVEDVPLDAAAAERVKKTWQSLLRLAEARVRLEASAPKLLFVRVATSPEGASDKPATAAESVLAMVDQKIADHVAALGKAFAAVDTARAAAVGIDDAALKNVESLGETLEEESRAIVEVRGTTPA